MRPIDHKSLRDQAAKKAYSKEEAGQLGLVDLKDILQEGAEAVGDKYRETMGRMEADPMFGTPETALGPKALRTAIETAPELALAATPAAPLVDIKDIMSPATGPMTKAIAATGLVPGGAIVRTVGKGIKGVAKPGVKAGGEVAQDVADAKAKAAKFAREQQEKEVARRAEEEAKAAARAAEEKRLKEEQKRQKNVEAEAGKFAAKEDELQLEMLEKKSLRQEEEYGTRDLRTGSFSWGEWDSPEVRENATRRSGMAGLPKYIDPVKSDEYGKALAEEIGEGTTGAKLITRILDSKIYSPEDKVGYQFDAANREILRKIQPFISDNVTVTQKAEHLDSWAALGTHEGAPIRIPGKKGTSVYTEARLPFAQHPGLARWRRGSSEDELSPEWVRPPHGAEIILRDSHKYWHDKGATYMWDSDYSDFKSGLSPEVVTHELLHAATVEKLRVIRKALDKRTRLAKNVSKESVEAYQELEELRQQVLRAVKPGDNTWKYPLENLTEFISYGMTHSEFRKFLDSVQIPGTKESVWTRLKAYLKRLWDAEPNSALAKFIDKTEAFFDAPYDREELMDLYPEVWKKRQKVYDREMRLAQEFAESQKKKARSPEDALRTKTEAAAKSAIRASEADKVSASTAGARTESETQQAKRLWEEKGTDSPYFQRWFGKSQVVDDAGKPLVMYHGTRYDPGFEAFDPKRMGKNSADFGYFGHGFYFSSDPKVALRYTDNYLGDTPPKLTEKVEEPGWKIVGHGPSSPSGAIGSFYLSLQKPYVWKDKRKNIANFTKELDPKFLPKDVQRAVLDRIGGVERLEPLTPFNRAPIVSKALREELEERGYDGIIVSGQHPEIVAFGQGQIKSSSSNRGTFDPKDPRITYGAAPGAFAVERMTRGQEEDEKP